MEQVFSRWAPWGRTSSRSEASPRPSAAAFVAVGLLYWLCAEIGGRLTMTPEGLSLLWPANAVLLAALVHYEGRGAWGFVAAAVVAQIAADLPRFGLQETFPFTAANLLEVGVAWWLLHPWRFEARFDHVHDLGRFVLAGPVVGAFAGAATGTVLLSAVAGWESSFLEMMLVWWLGHAVGLLIFTPLFLSFSTVEAALAPRVPSRPVVDAGMAVGGLILLAMLVIANGNLVLGVHTRPVLLLPFVLYAAIRLPFGWVCVIVMLVAVIMAGLSVVGRSPYGPDPTHALIWTQEFVLVMSVSALGLSSLLTNVRIGEDAARSVHLDRVPNGLECLHYLRREPPWGSAPAPDLVLLDLNMPVLDGRATLAAIGADRALRHVPVVAFTTSSREEDVVHMYDLGCSGYVVKPVDVERFFQAVKEVCTYWFSTVQLPNRHVRR